jgi:hypothetical protein
MANFSDIYEDLEYDLDLFSDDEIIKEIKLNKL